MSESTPSEGPTYNDYLQQIEADYRRLRHLISVNPVAPVPTCPGWSLHDLARHVAAAHRRAERVVRTGQEPTPGEPEAGDAGPLLDDAYAALRQTLAGHDPAEQTWTWSPRDHTVGFWARRMAHETVVHRVDAELAVGDPTPVPHAIAVDGIAELFDLRVPARPGPAGDPFDPVVVRTGPRAWRVLLEPSQMRVEPGPGAARTTLTGEPSELYLFLWGRRPLDAVRVEGDQEAVAELRRRLAAGQ